MRFFTIIILLLFPYTVAFAQKAITLEDIWKEGAFAPNGIPGFNFQDDGVHYTRLENNAIVQYDLRNGEQTATLFAPHMVVETAKGWKKSFDGYQFSSDGSKILLATGTEPIYRWSTQSEYFIFDQKSKALSRLNFGTKQRYATFSPDANKVAFFMDNDLYIKELSTGKIAKITQDGKINEIINGGSDWVYEEEFELVKAFEWSPDGKYLAYFRFDESEVPEMTMEMYKGGVYPELVKFKYPKVGEKNAQVTAHIFDVAAGRATKVQIPDRAEGLDDYLPRLVWVPGNQLCLTWMNRHQNHQKLFLAEAGSGITKLLLEEKNQCYIDLHEVCFLPNGSGFIVQSEKSGFNHLYLHDLSGKEVVALTKGNWDVTDLYGVDTKNECLYYQAAAEKPMQREIYQVNLKGQKTKMIGQLGGVQSAQFSTTFDYFVHTQSTLNSPPQYQVLDRKGNKIRSLEANEALAAKQMEHGVQPLTFFNFKTTENVDLNGWILKPNAPQYQNQKLPLLMFVYGGPGSQQVLDQWKGNNYWWFQMLAQQGYVVACVDNRGTGGRGEAFKKITYKQLGHYETIDQIEAAKYLGTLPYIDAGRIGIFGWSYGGYMSSLSILKGSGTFQSAIAVAPVTNWKWYDSVYTERYMQTHAENKVGYEENAPTNFVESLSGKYLLVHGLGDDNVHFQHSAEMTNHLILANKPFDSMIYPNRNHGINGGNARLHLYAKMTRFLEESLKNSRP